MRGRIKALHAGFGFIVGGGQSFFFHRSDMAPASDYDFNQLEEGDAVSFEVVEPQPERGPRAAQVAWEPTQ